MIKQCVFITGGASGLGRALAENYARAGRRVCIGDVNEKRGQETQAHLRQLGDQDAKFIVCDVTKDADFANVLGWIEKEWQGLDLLINNAGVALAGDVASLALADWQWILDINLLGVVRGCHTFIPVFRKQRSGHIVNIASMAGLVHPPFMAPYNATKAAVVALSETLLFELERDGIAVSVVCPSFFKTNLAETSRSTRTDLSVEMRKLIDGSGRNAEQIAEIVARGIASKRHLILTEPDGRLASVAKRFLPFSAYKFLLMRRMP